LPIEGALNWAKADVDKLKATRRRLPNLMRLTERERFRMAAGENGGSTKNSISREMIA
jgi:hypothetical protein